MIKLVLLVIHNQLQDTFLTVHERLYCEHKQVRSKSSYFILFLKYLHGLLCVANPLKYCEIHMDMGIWHRKVICISHAKHKLKLDGVIFFICLYRVLKQYQLPSLIID